MNITTLRPKIAFAGRDQTETPLDEAEAKRLAAAALAALDAEISALWACRWLDTASIADMLFVRESLVANRLAVIREGAQG